MPNAQNLKTSVLIDGEWVELTPTEMKKLSNPVTKVTSERKSEMPITAYTAIVEIIEFIESQPTKSATIAECVANTNCNEKQVAKFFAALNSSAGWSLDELTKTLYYVNENEVVYEEHISEIEIFHKGVPKKTITGGHAKLERAIELAVARKNIFLSGPTGSGKTTIGNHVADALDLDFAFINCTTGMSESKFEGRSLPIGAKGQFEYIQSQFVYFYETGGVFFIDEIDAADPNVLLFINNALAGDVLHISKRVGDEYAYRHPDFICMAAANTLGTGGNRMYSGRQALDDATMDRFRIGKIFVDYDKKLEEKIAEDYPKELQRLWDIRKAINDHGLERALSTRFIAETVDMMNNDWSLQMCLDSFVLGWREDEIRKVESSVTGLELKKKAV